MGPVVRTPTASGPASPPHPGRAQRQQKNRWYSKGLVRCDGDLAQGRSSARDRCRHECLSLGSDAAGEQGGHDDDRGTADRDAAKHEQTVDHITSEFLPSHCLNSEMPVLACFSGWLYSRIHESSACRQDSLGSPSWIVPSKRRTGPGPGVG